MKSFVSRAFGALIAFLTNRPAVDVEKSASQVDKVERADAPAARRPAAQKQRSRLSPGALEAQDALARQQSRGDGAQLARPRRPAPRPRTRIFSVRASQHAGPRAGYRWGQASGDKTRDPSLRTPHPSVLPDRVRPAMHDDRVPRAAEREVRRFRRARRAAEAAASAGGPPESRLSPEAVEAQETLVREQSQRDAKARAQERPYRTPLRDRTRIGPLEGIRQAQARLPKRDRRVDYLVTAGFITAAVIVGGLTRLDVYDYSGLPWILAAGLAAALISLLVLDYRRWYGSFRVRFTRMGMGAGLVFFVGITSIGRLGELAPVPLPDACSIEQARKVFTDEVSEHGRVRFIAAMDRLTGKLRRPGRIKSDSERAEVYRERGLWRARLGDPERALADYQRATELDPNQIATYVVRAEMFAAAECPVHGREDLAAIQRLHSSSEDGEALLYGAYQLLHAARVLDEPRFLYATIDVARRAANWLALPHEAEVLQGRALASLGRLPEALAVLTFNIERYRISTDGRYYRGLVNRRLGHTQAALQDFENAISRQRTPAGARAALGITLFGSGQASKGLQTLNEAVLLDGTDAFARQWRGQALLQLGQPQAARADFKQAVLLEPDMADPYVGLAVAELALGNRKQAAEALAESRIRPVSWVDEPAITALLEHLERELGTPSSN